MSLLISAIPFKPSWTEEAMALALDFFKDQSEWKGNTNYRVVSDNPSSAPQFKICREDFIGRVCHRGIYDTGVRNRSLVATEIGTKRLREWKEGHEFFLNWFVNESFFGKWIVNKDAGLSFIRDNGIIVSADVHAAIFQLTMIISRHFAEIHDDSFSMFKTLVGKGTDPYVAYVSAFNTGLSAGANVKSAVQSIQSHRAVALLPLKPLARLVKEKITDHFIASFGSPLDPAYHYRTNNNYNGGSQLFYKKGEVPDPYVVKFPDFSSELLKGDKDFVEALKNYRKEMTQGEHYRPPNPFSASYIPAKGDQISYEELYAFVVPWYMENRYDRSN